MAQPAAAIPAVVRVDIEDLLSEFSSRVDEGRGATVHELFVESGRITTPQFALANRDEIRERFTARARDTSRKSRHYWSNPGFSGGPERVTVVTNTITLVTMPGKPTAIMGGTSTDVVVRRDGGWAFQSRQLEVVFEGTLGPAEPRP